MKARILIVDDHEIVREGICTLLAKSGEDWEVCGQASDADEAVAAVKSLVPDLVILDITMPGVSGLVAARRINLLNLGSRLLMFTMHDSPRLGIEAREAGAQGYVLKSQAARDLVVAIRSLLQGKPFFGAIDDEPAPNKEGSSSGAALFEAASALPLLCPAFS